MIRLVNIVVVFVLLGCSVESNGIHSGSNIANEQMNYITKKYGVQSFGIGGFNDGSLKGYSLTFESHEKVNLNQARKLIVDILEDIIQNSNECQSQRCLPNFSYRNFEVSIIFSDMRSQKFITEELGIASVSVSQGNVDYSVDKRGNYKLETIFEEPYSEAYEKVTGKKFVESATQNSIN